MTKSKNIWIIAAFVIALALGFFGGRLTGKHKVAETVINGDRAAGGSTARPATRNRGESSLGKRNISNKRGAKDVSQTMKVMQSRLADGSMHFRTDFEIWKIVRNFSEDEVREALLIAEDTKNKLQRENVQRMLMRRWGKINGEAAMDYALNDQDPAMQTFVISGAFISWSEENPEEALNWYQANQDKVGILNAREEMYNRIVYKALAQHDLAQALEQVKSIENIKKRENVLESITMGIVNQPEKFKDFVQFLDKEKDPYMKDSIMAFAISRMMYNNPGVVKNYINTIENDEEKAKVTKTFIQRWSKMEPETAIKWGMKKAADKEMKASIIAENISTWVDRDFISAAKWYDQQPVELKSDKAVSNVAYSLSYKKQYEQAFAWANRGNDDVKMADTKKAIYKRWFNAAPAEAKRWAEGPGREALEGIDLEYLEGAAQEDLMGIDLESVE